MQGKVMLQRVEHDIMAAEPDKGERKHAYSIICRSGRGNL